MKIFDDYIKKIHEFIVIHYDDEDLRIQQVELVPKFVNRIYFNVNLFRDNEQNRQLNNVFIIFFLSYVFKKIDLTFKNYLPYISEINEEYSKIIEIYSSYEFKLRKMGNSHIIFIDYSKVQNEIVRYELGDDSTIQLKILTNVFQKQNNQIQQLYFYIYPLFSNWLVANKIDLTDTEEWQEFFKLDIGW